jgi:hypothetical protein
MSDQYPPPGSYPPPSGGDQPPQYGAPQYGQQPTSGGPGGAPFGPPGGAPFGAPPPPPKKSSAGKIVLIVLGILLVLTLICCGILYATGSSMFDAIKNSSTNAKVDDCLKGDAIEGDTTKDVKLTIVKCDDASAKYKVVGIKESVPQADALKAETTVCDAFIDKGADRVLWQGTDVKSGQALCLAPVK